MPRIEIYDTTLRDGSQGEGVNFSLQDKLQITQRLDALGFDFVEGGYPLSNPKDAEYFQAVRDLGLENVRIAAFGMTRRRGVAGVPPDRSVRSVVEGSLTGSEDRDPGAPFEAWSQCERVAKSQPSCRR